MRRLRATIDRLAGLFQSTRGGAPPVYIFGRSYNPLSGGMRSLHLLCHHLNRAGFEAYLASTKAITPDPRLATPALTPAVEADHKQSGREPIVIYAEVVRGNPLNATIVVRYLLNKPGLLAQGAVETYGPDDLFFHFAPEHVLPGTRSFDLFMPIVDRSIYYPPFHTASRRGFTVVSKRASPDPATFPDWVAPLTALSHADPRPAAELADLYRQSRALVTFERSSTIYEAQLCGCPVICIPGEHFHEGTYQPRFKGLGMVWGWNEDGLAAATEETAAFRAIYGEIEASLSGRLRAAIAWVIDETQRKRRPRTFR